MNSSHDPQPKAIALPSPSSERQQNHQEKSSESNDGLVIPSASLRLRGRACLLSIECHSVTIVIKLDTCFPSCKDEQFATRETDGSADPFVHTSSSHNILFSRPRHCDNDIGGSLNGEALLTRRYFRSIKCPALRNIIRDFQSELPVSHHA